MKQLKHIIRQISEIPYLLGQKSSEIPYLLRQKPSEIPSNLGQKPSEIPYLLGQKYRTFWGRNTVPFGAGRFCNSLYVNWFQGLFSLIIILIKVLINFNHIETAPKFLDFWACFFGHAEPCTQMVNNFFRMVFATYEPSAASVVLDNEPDYLFLVVM